MHSLAIIIIFHKLTIWLVCFQGLPTELKKRNELKKICASTLASEFPEDCKFYPADTKDDLHKVSRPIWDEVIGLCILKHTSKANQL